MNLKSTVVSSIESMLKSHTDEVVRKLSEKYLFSQEDALAFVGLSTVSLYNRDSSVKRMSPKPKRSAQLKSDVRDGPFPFPYQSTDASYCEALRYNYGLYTQCCVETEDKYCSECLAEGCSKGTIEGRDDPMFKGRPGKPMIVYSKVLKKLGHSVEYAKSQAETYGKEIDESVYELVSKKGRPKKEKTVVVGEVVPKKKGRRPKAVKESEPEGGVRDVFLSIIDNTCDQTGYDSGSEMGDHISLSSSSSSEKSNNSNKSEKQLKKEENKFMVLEDKLSKQNDKKMQKAQELSEKEEKKAEKEKLASQKKLEKATKEAARFAKLEMAISKMKKTPGGEPTKQAIVAKAQLDTLKTNNEPDEEEIHETSREIIIESVKLFEPITTAADEDIESLLAIEAEIYFEQATEQAKKADGFNYNAYEAAMVELAEAVEKNHLIASDAAKQTGAKEVDSVETGTVAKGVDNVETGTVAITAAEIVEKRSSKRNAKGGAKKDAKEDAKGDAKGDAKKDAKGDAKGDAKKGSKRGGNKDKDVSAETPVKLSLKKWTETTENKIKIINVLTLDKRFIISKNYMFDVDGDNEYCGVFDKVEGIIPKKYAVDDDNEDEEGEDANVIIIEDIKYLMTFDKTLYNAETQQPVGTYEPKTESIIALPDDDEIEEEVDAAEVDAEELQQQTDENDKECEEEEYVSELGEEDSDSDDDDEDDEADGDDNSKKSQ